MASIILPILLPLNINNGKSTNTIHGITYNVTGLDTLAWSNVSPERTSRYWAHLVLAVAVVMWVCFMFHQEMMHYVLKRQEYLTSAGHRMKASSTTVLITDIPKKLCTTEALEKLYGDFPGGVRRIWLNRDFSKLVDQDKRRKQFEDRLENAETNLIRKAVKKHRKQQKQASKEARKPSPTSSGRDKAGMEMHKPNAQAGETKLPDPDIDSLPIQEACRRDLQYDIDTNAVWAKYLTPKQRPTMRVPTANHTTLFNIPLVGRMLSTNVDTSK